MKKNGLSFGRINFYYWFYAISSLIAFTVTSRGYSVIFIIAFGLLYYVSIGLGFLILTGGLAYRKPTSFIISVRALWLLAGIQILALLLNTGDCATGYTREHTYIEDLVGLSPCNIHIDSHSNVLYSLYSMLAYVTLFIGVLVKIIVDTIRTFEDSDAGSVSKTTVKQVLYIILGSIGVFGLATLIVIALIHK